MIPPPHFLVSKSMNPASLQELQVLQHVATRLQNQGDVKGSIPYLAKICQIVDNQRPEPEHRDAMDTVRAQAHAQLAEAYFKTFQFTLCESQWMLALDIWEKRVSDDASLRESLLHAYDQLKSCYETLGKTQMAHYMDKRKSKLLS